MQLVCVPPDQVARAWPHVRDLIVAAMKRGGLSSYRPVEDAVLRGDALLWLAIPREDGRQRPGALRGLCRKRPDGDEARIAAAAVTELHETEWRKVCVLVACGGAGRHGQRLCIARRQRHCGQQDAAGDNGEFHHSRFVGLTMLSLSPSHSAQLHTA
jgi:hypothetical protein